MTPEQFDQLSRENAELRNQVAKGVEDRRAADKKEHEEMKAHLNRQDLKLNEIVTKIDAGVSKVDAVDLTCRHNAKRTRKIERRLSRGDTRFEKNDERMSVLERDFKFRKMVRTWAIRFATAVGLSWVLWKLGIKE